MSQLRSLTGSWRWRLVMLVVLIEVIAVAASAAFAFQVAENQIMMRERSALQAAVTIMIQRLPAGVSDTIQPEISQDGGVGDLRLALDPVVQGVASAHPGVIVGFYSRSGGIIVLAPRETRVAASRSTRDWSAVAGRATEANEPVWETGQTGVEPSLAYAVPVMHGPSGPSLIAFAIRSLAQVYAQRRHAAMQYSLFAVGVIAVAAGVAFLVVNRLAAGLSDPGSSRQLRDLQEVTYDLSRLDLPHVILKRAARAIGRVMQTNKVMIAVVDPEDPALLQVKESRGYNLDGLRIPVSGSLLDHVYRCRVPRVLYDAQEDPTFFLPRHVCLEAGVRAGVYAPLVGRNGVIGVCGANHAAAGAFGERDAAVLASLASQISIALENAQAHAELRLASVTDSLTGLYNRRYLEASEAEIGPKGPISLLMVDLDQFKTVNDTLGHEAGDEVLRQVAHRLSAQIRANDRVVRFGGDEFLVILPDADREKARVTGERIRAALIRQPICINGQELQLTASIGVAEWSPEDRNPDPQQLLRWADAALYRAKGAGRNRVVVVEAL